MTRRFVRRERKYKRIMPRDKEIIESVFEARYLTNLHIHRLHFSPTAFSWCKTRTRLLFDKGFLKKRLAHQNEPDIYYLGLRGRRYLQAKYGYDKEWLEKVAGVAGSGEMPSLQVRHDLTVSNLYVDARLECRSHGWEMVWSNARMLELAKLGVQPDARITASKGEKVKQAFIEFTNVPPSDAEMAGKLSGYERYFDSVMPTVVLWFTTSQARADQLASHIEGYGYRSYILIGLVEDKSHFLTTKIWRWSESEDKVAWIKPS